MTIRRLVGGCSAAVLVAGCAASNHAGAPSDASAAGGTDNGYYYHFFSEVTGEGRVPFVSRARVITGPWETIVNFGNYIGAKLAIYTANDQQEAGYVDLDSLTYPCSAN